MKEKTFVDTGVRWAKLLWYFGIWFTLQLGPPEFTILCYFMLPFLDRYTNPHGASRMVCLAVRAEETCKAARTFDDIRTKTDQIFRVGHHEDTPFFSRLSTLFK